ncbi:MAG: TMEM175 family protein [Chthoniobacter sp.]
MEKGRLEAFSDGVIAIIITIMVLELKVPHGGDFATLKPLVPVFLSYILSFIYVGIYWNNHHHLFQVTERVNGAILWANLHLLFWLSLIPFVTGWVGENHFEAVPTALYGVVLFCSSMAYMLLQCAIVKEHGSDSKIAGALGRDWKGKISSLGYLAAIGLAFVNEWLADAIYVLVATMWFIPDRRLARVVE